MAASCLRILLRTVLVLGLFLASDAAVSYVASADSSAPSTSNSTTTLSALLAFKEAIHTDPSLVLASWNATSGGSYCAWPGVQCARGTQDVVGLLLDSQGLGGSIAPALIAGLPHLTYLNLSNNSMQGAIPPSLGLHLPSLSRLDLSLNSLSGPIPPSLSNCSLLQYLDLSKNSLSDSFPSSLPSSLPLLVFLDLSANRISGPLPPDIGLLSNLQFFQLYQGLLTGSIPDSLTNCTNLVWLDLSDNLLSGPLPTDWSRLNQLEFLKVQDNDMYGSLPSSLGNCTALSILSLQNNSLTGVLPESFGNLAKLQDVRVYLNYLTGSIPPSIVNCSRLVYFEVAFNNFTGSIPQQIGRLTQLQWLTFTGNPYLGGTLPESVGDCEQLMHLTAEYTAVGGTLPNSLFNLSLLIDLKLTSSRFSGRLSRDVRNLTSLVNLLLSDNAFEGEIPQSLGELQSLQGLELQHNRFSGFIPAELGDCASLSVLDLSDNLLSGRLPPSLFELHSLNKLYLQKNEFYGEVPDLFASLSRLNSLSLAHNRFTGAIPFSLADLHTLNVLLDLSYNNLRGPIPPALGGNAMVQVISLSHNMLMGPIPSTLGDCAGLQVLDLSWNRLQGQIPARLANMKSLQYLNLSHNELSGHLPLSLGQMKDLLFLNVSFNHLVGWIPQDGVYKNFDSSSFEGNADLCGQPLDLVCPEGHPSQKAAIIASAAAAALAFVLSILCVCGCWCLCTKKRGKRSLQDSVHDDPESESFGFEKPHFKAWTARELRVATYNFDSANEIGSGSVSVCFRGLWEEAKGKKLIAIKKLNVEESYGAEARRSFVTELKTLCNVRHRHLVKVLGYCVDSGVVALVMEYMEKGNLDEHLHGSGYSMSWDERLNVAMDVAEGLVYLHEEYVQPIIHCDLKPKNILLGSDMVAKISDFGIARLLDRNNQSGDLSISKFRGTFGYAAPEYAGGSRISTKVDVYSYGVLLMELVTGMRPISEDVQGKGATSLAMWVEELRREGRAGEALDPTLDGADDQSLAPVRAQTEEVLSVGLACTSASPRDRPPMRDVRDAISRLKAQRLCKKTLPSSPTASSYPDLQRLLQTSGPIQPFPPTSKWILDSSIEVSLQGLEKHRKDRCASF